MNKQSIKKRFEKLWEDLREEPEFGRYNKKPVWNFISKEIDKAVKEEGERIKDEVVKVNVSGKTYNYDAEGAKIKILQHLEDLFMSPKLKKLLLSTLKPKQDK